MRRPRYTSSQLAPASSVPLFVVSGHHGVEAGGGAHRPGAQQDRHREEHGGQAAQAGPRTARPGQEGDRHGQGGHEEHGLAAGQRGERQGSTERHEDSDAPSPGRPFADGDGSEEQRAGDQREQHRFRHQSTVQSDELRVERGEHGGSHTGHRPGQEAGGQRHEDDGDAAQERSHQAVSGGRVQPEQIGDGQERGP